MSSRIRLLFVTLLSLFLVGCATWSKPSSPYFNASAMYKVQPPWEWMKYLGKDFLLTRDGIWLENITIERFKVDKKLGHTKKKFMPDMLPDEVAEVEIDELRSDQDITDFNLLENVPANVGGKDGFKIVYHFRDKTGLKKKVVHYGFRHEKWIYRIVYSAAKDYYFGKNVDDFEKMVKTFEFLGNK